MSWVIVRSWRTDLVSASYEEPPRRRAFHVIDTASRDIRLVRPLRVHLLAMLCRLEGGCFFVVDETKEPREGNGKCRDTRTRKPLPSAEWHTISHPLNFKLKRIPYLPAISYLMNNL